MASPAAGRDVPNASPQDEPEHSGPNHPEPACLEAQKWIEAVTGKSFGDKDFRSGLENGILLCELLSAIKPGLVKKINRLPTPIAGLDNLSVFLRGCEELGLKGSQLFDPGDLQDTSIRANLKDSDCNRKLKNVLNTVFWLGKAASGCASYSGPTLNLKEFEGLLAQMKLESDEGGDSSQKRSVRDSGYDCWDSERSDSLSPPRHTRDNSLDSLDSFGSRSQHSPSPDVVNRGHSDGRGSDSEADAPSRRPDVRKDDMLARRTASSESRNLIPFNQFLPNRTNASSYIPTPRRKPHTEEGEQRRMSRRVAFMSEDTESVSMGDMLNEEEVGHLPPLSQSRYERMHEQYNNFQEDDDHWQNELARWKNRRRSTSQELIKKEEERKRMEKRMKEEGSYCNKRKSIKTYKEIVEEKERREADLCDAYRNASTPEEAAMVLQRYALRFTISDATLDSLKLPRSTANPKQDLDKVDTEHKTTSPVNETSEPLHKPEPEVIKDQWHTEPEETETNTAAQQETSVSVSSSSPTPGNTLSLLTNSDHVPPQSLELNEPQSKPTESPTKQQKQLITGDAKPQAKHTPPHIAQLQPHTTQPVHTLPSPPSVSPRPVPLLAAKPYCQPRNILSGHKPVKMDGLVRVNGEVTEDLSVSTPPTSARHSPPEVKDVSSKQMEKDVPSVMTEKDVPSVTTEKDAPSKQMEKDVPSMSIATKQETVEQTPPPKTERSTTSLGSAISSLIGGRNCTVTTTIVTELTHVEPHHPDSQSNGQVNGTSGLSGSPVGGEKTQPATSPNSMQEYSPTVTEGLEESSVTIETPMLNLAKRVNHWVWDPNEERKRLESWQQEQERLLQEQYQKEQEKLKNEWEKAQLEVQEEERKHNEEERRILEETVTPLNPTGLLNQRSVQTRTTSSAPENNETEKGNVPLQQNGQRREGNEDQHASKLHFFQDSSCDGEHSKKQELWKTASLDRNPQLNQPHIVKRSESHDAVTGKQQPSPSSPQPPSPSRCVSGKRLCSGCSQPLGKGAAMIIDTLGLFFHVQCFKCGVCDGQLGDASAGTDVRIRNGLLSCHECYIASRGRGQPTTL
ncbi:LIM and calponin homology domains-containing protein 1-like isoform X3 [Sander lucioperca]|uniref:LIM and calponin homology domains-containing protein 1-like isoform X3 n=1 Tax=Sander lucioperca TaxID=283035 RepID=UPI00125CD4A7|nr:LIM and calponin homology domains-containing protein 1-like isoform X3 [Sander lucioperca]